MLGVIMLGVIMVGIIMLGTIIVIMLNVAYKSFMLSVVAPI
jgi:hypothetical protein